MLPKNINPKYSANLIELKWEDLIFLLMFKKFNIHPHHFNFTYKISHRQ